MSHAVNKYYLIELLYKSKINEYLSNERRLLTTAFLVSAFVRQKEEKKFLLSSGYGSFPNFSADIDTG